MRKNSVSSLTYGALFAALVGVLVYINRLLANGLEVYFFWVIPVLIVVYRCKFDFRDTMMTSFSMVLLTIILAGPISTTTFYVVTAIIAGIVYAQGFINGRSATYLICSVIAVSLLVMILSTFVFSSFFGINLMEEIKYYQEVMQQSCEMMSMGGMAVNSTTMSILTSEKIIFSIIVISCVLTSVLEGVLVHFLNYLVLKKLKMELPPMKPVSQIYCPTFLKVIIAVIFIASIFTSAKYPEFFSQYMLMLLVIAMLLCFCFGYIFIVTIYSLYSKKRSFSRGLLIGLICLFCCYIVVFIGLFDIFSNYRKRLIERYNIYVKQ